MRRAFIVAVLLSILAFPAASQTRRFRVAIGGLSAESNSLYPAKLVMSEERRGGMQTPAQWLADMEKSNTIASGVIAAARTLPLDIVPVLRAGAGSLGMVEAASFEARLRDLVQQLKTASPPFDGVILALHGAMVVDGFPHGDTEVVRRVREAMGKSFPIVVTHDFHANVSPEIVEYSDVLITYKETPHLDPKDRGTQAATILHGMLSGKVRPTQAIAKPPMLLNILFHDTFGGPLKPLVDETKRLEKQPKILAASMPGGYQWADVQWMGPSVIVVTDNDPELAKREAQRIADRLYAMREHLVPRFVTPAEAVKIAMESDKFPVALMDTGDNIGGGSTGDGTFILAELIRQQANGWVMTVADREANEAAFKAGVGGEFDQMVGGKIDRMHGEPVRIRGKVKALTNGQYVETEVRHGGGRYNDMGLTAVIEVEGSTRDLPTLLLLTRRPTSPNSLNQLISNGVYPQRQKILVAKGTTAPRAAYLPVAARIIEVNSAGATDVNPGRFTFKQVRRPMHGLP
jgi:microcystin degradation protein MlrC